MGLLDGGSPEMVGYEAAFSGVGSVDAFDSSEGLALSFPVFRRCQGAARVSATTGTFCSRLHFLQVCHPETMTQ